MAGIAICGLLGLTGSHCLGPIGQNRPCSGTGEGDYRDGTAPHRPRQHCDTMLDASPQGVEGNKQADATARAAAEREGRAEPAYLLEASLAHLSRKTTKT